MSSNWPKPGINHVGEFQASGHALAVAAQNDNQTVNLHYVAKSITFTNSDSSAETVKLFDSQGGASKVISIAGNTSIKIDGKFLKFELVGNNISAVVEVTNIPSGSYLQPEWTALANITS
tara:strand:- start:546 stop:905 length:360 start_codon:yes stop_codon:yes gene_type:complete